MKTRKFKPPVYLMPAHGRVYNTKAAMLTDWIAGKDFKIQQGPYTSVRDAGVLKKEYSLYLIWRPNDMSSRVKIPA